MGTLGAKRLIRDLHLLEPGYTDMGTWTINLFEVHVAAKVGAKRTLNPLNPYNLKPKNSTTLNPKPVNPKP